MDYNLIIAAVGALVVFAGAYFTGRKNGAKLAEDAFHSLLLLLRADAADAKEVERLQKQVGPRLARHAHELAAAERDRKERLS